MMAKLLWTLKRTFGPTGRDSCAMAYDPLRKRVVLFGGATKNANGEFLLNDTWEWDGVNWTQVADTGPSPRRQFRMSFDYVRNTTILHGGNLSPGAGEFSPMGDTWEWDGDAWTQLANNGPPRCLYAMASDPDRQRVVLHGGSLSPMV